MSKIVVTKAQKERIVSMALSHSTRQIAAECSVSRDTVRRVFKKFNIVIPEETKKKLRSQAMQSKTTFTPEEDAIIKENYLELPIKTLGNLIGRSYTGVNLSLIHI